MGGNGVSSGGGMQVVLLSAINVKPTVLIEPELSAGLVFLFTTMAGEQLPALAFPLEHARLGGALADMVKVAAKQSVAMLAEHQSASVAAVVAAAVPEPPPVVVKCAVCGVRIFGVVAERGSCESCFAKLPPAEDRPTLIGEEG